MDSNYFLKDIFEPLFKYSSHWLAEVCQGQSKETMAWPLSNGEITALCFSTWDIPKAGLSILKREDRNEFTCRVGLNIYIRNPKVPDGSFAILLYRQQESGFVGGVIELFPVVRIDRDIELFKNKMKEVARKHKQNYEVCSKGLVGAFRLKGSDENLGAEAGFNFYRSGMEANPQNILFAKEAFISALGVYNDIIIERTHEQQVEDILGKEPFWEKHLQYMTEEDVGIKMASEQGIPMDFFKFSAFPPAGY